MPFREIAGAILGALPKVAPLFWQNKIGISRFEDLFELVFYVEFFSSIFGKCRFYFWSGRLCALASKPHSLGGDAVPEPLLGDPLKRVSQTPPKLFSALACTGCLLELKKPQRSDFRQNTMA